MGSSNPAFAVWNNNTHPDWWKDKGLRRMSVHILFLYFCIFTFGYDGSLLSGLQAVPRWQKDFHSPAGATLGLISASFYIPKIITPWIASWIADRYGRRICLFIFCCVGVVGVFINTFATGVGMLIAGRVVLGAGLGAQATIAPPMVQELCHPRLRAVAGGMWLVFFGVGGIVSSWLCFGMVGWDNSWAWRLPTLVQILGTLSVAIYIGCGFMAESPRWLVSKGRVDEALRSLAKMHANGDVNDELVQHELNEIKRGVEIDGQSNAGYSALIQTPGNRRRLLVLMVIAATGQINGAALVSYYLVPILKQVGITSSSQQAGVNGGLSIWGTICIIIAAQFVERLGRRPLWLTGAVGVLASFILLAAFSGAYKTTGSPSLGAAVIPWIFTFTAFNAVAWAAVANLYVAEILPFGLRARGMSVYVCTQSCALAFNQYVNPIALAAISWKYYFVYIGVQICFLVFAWFFLVETKGYTIEEVSRLFDGGKDAANEMAAFALAGTLEANKGLSQAEEKHVEHFQESVTVLRQ